MGLKYDFTHGTTGQSGAAIAESLDVSINYRLEENGGDCTGVNPVPAVLGLHGGMNDDRQGAATAELRVAFGS